MGSEGGLWVLELDGGGGGGGDGSSLAALICLHCFPIGSAWRRITAIECLHRIMNCVRHAAGATTLCRRLHSFGADTWARPVSYLSGPTAVLLPQAGHATGADKEVRNVPRYQGTHGSKVRLPTFCPQNGRYPSIWKAVTRAVRPHTTTPPHLQHLKQHHRLLVLGTGVQQHRRPLLSVLASRQQLLHHHNDHHSGLFFTCHRASAAP